MSGSKYIAKRYLFSRNDYGILTLITSEELLADDKKTKIRLKIEIESFPY
jgi:hypothetical protein